MRKRYRSAKVTCPFYRSPTWSSSLVITGTDFTEKKFFLYSLFASRQSQVIYRNLRFFLRRLPHAPLSQWLLRWWQIIGSTARETFVRTHPSKSRTRLKTQQFRFIEMRRRCSYTVGCHATQPAGIVAVNANSCGVLGITLTIRTDQTL